MTERNTSTCLHFHSPQLTIHCILHAQIWKNFPIIYETTTFMMLFTDGTILHRPSSWMKTRSNRSVLDVTWTMTWWILDSLGKCFHENCMYITTWVYLLIALLPYCCRICSGMDDVLRLSSNFIESLLTTSSRHWIDQVKRHNVDIFSYNALFMPYQSDVQKSLFVVLGANNIKDYMKRGFAGTRPCVLHILPYASSNRS